MFDPLGLEDLMNGVVRGGERRVHVAAPVGPAGKHVAFELPDRVLGIVDHRHRVGQRAKRPVRDLDELGRLPGDLPRVGDDKSKDITQIGRSASLRDEHRPVGVDDADPQIARDLGSGEHGLDAGHGARRSRVDLEHVGPGVVREPQRSVKHARNPDVVHIVTVAERELDSFVPGAAGPEAPQQGSPGVIRRLPAPPPRRGSCCNRCTGTGAPRDNEQPRRA